MLLKKGPHEGPALTAAQVTLLTTWLNKEVAVRGSQAPVNLFAKLGNCLDQTKFNAIGIGQLRTVPRQGENANTCTGCNNASCQKCHESGEFAMYSNNGGLNPQVATFPELQNNATSPEGIYIISKYITTSGTQLLPSTAIQDKANVVKTGTPYSHPLFTLSATSAQAITDFANDAIGKYNNKLCGQ
jgi:hypothetical protein